jgi:hypothetical protein
MTVRMCAWHGTARTQDPDDDGANRISHSLGETTPHSIYPTLTVRLMWTDVSRRGIVITPQSQLVSYTGLPGEVGAH